MTQKLCLKKSPLNILVWYDFSTQLLYSSIFKKKIASSDKLRVSMRDPKPVEMKVVINTKYIYKYVTKSHFITHNSHSKMSYHTSLLNKTNKQTWAKGT